MERLEPLPETQAALDELLEFDGPDVAELLRGLERRVRRLVPDLVGLSLGLVRHGLTFTLVSTDSKLSVLDAAQYLDGGPCVDAADSGEEVFAMTNDPLDEERWRLFSQAAAVEGVASSLSLPLYGDGKVIGGANLYASTETGFKGRHEEVAGLFGARAVEAVTNADLSFSTRLEAAAAPQQLRDRAQIETAAGIIAAQRGITVEDAHRHLTQAAARAGAPEVVVARVIVQIHARGGQG